MTRRLDSETIYDYSLKILFILLAVMNVTLSGMLFIKEKYNLYIVIQPCIEDIDISDIGDINELTELKLLPMSIAQSFIGNDWELEVNPEWFIENNARHNRGWTGYTDYSAKKLVVNGNSSILHEFGHYLDWANNFPKEHSQLYLEEADKASEILGTYSMTNGREYFAECFRFWLSAEDEWKERFKKEVPNTYKYLDDLEKNNWGLKENRVYVRKYNWNNPDELYDHWDAEQAARQDK